MARMLMRPFGSVDEAARKLQESLRRLFVSIPPLRNLVDGK
jgi:hypothetical protein